MRYLLVVLALSLPLWTTQAFGGEAEIRSAQAVIDNQIRAFLAGDDAAAYSYAAPGIKRLFPTLETFMKMVKDGYQPVYHPRNYAFGKALELSPTALAQQVLVVGPDGKDYEAIYTLELQPDGSFRITGVSLHEANALSL